MSTNTLPAYKKDLLQACVAGKTLQFGTFTLKSGRTSPYFFQAGAFNTASLLTSLCTAYAHTIHTHPKLPGSFDVIFGPAYKGIPLAAGATIQLASLDPAAYSNRGYAFNRKEKKNHGEGGSIVGASLRGKRVLIIDDVMTAGTAIREAVGIIKAEGGVVAGVVVALDRQERLTDDKGSLSTLQSVRKELGVDVVPILTLDDIIAGVESEEDRRSMNEYRAKYGA